MLKFCFFVCLWIEIFVMDQVTFEFSLVNFVDLNLFNSMWVEASQDFHRGDSIYKESKHAKKPRGDKWKLLGW